MIGSGGMGTVFESTNPDDGRAVAVKLLGVDFREDERGQGRFLDEGRMCQRLIHPNIVRVFDVAEAEDGTPYIVMELLEGVPLSAYTRAGVRVPLVQAAAILHGILAGARRRACAGDRPSRPQARRTSSSRASRTAPSPPRSSTSASRKVMDAAGGMGSKTRTGVLLGTPAYMSPEQIKNAKDVDARSDLWSAGVMLYEMLTGRVRVSSTHRICAPRRRSSTRRRRRSRTSIRSSRGSRPFVQLAMQKDRAQRYQSALEMARALAGAMGRRIERRRARADQPASQHPERLGRDAGVAHPGERQRRSRGAGDDAISCASRRHRGACERPRRHAHQSRGARRDRSSPQVAMAASRAASPRRTCRC